MVFTAFGLNRESPFQVAAIPLDGIDCGVSVACMSLLIECIMPSFLHLLQDRGAMGFLSAKVDSFILQPNREARQQAMAAMLQYIKDSLHEREV